MKEMLLNNWSVIRFLRLGMGIFFCVQAIQTQEWIVGVIALLLIVQALTNTGCCGTSCSVPANNKNKALPEDVTFTEIKEQNKDR